MAPTIFLDATHKHQIRTDHIYEQMINWQRCILLCVTPYFFNNMNSAELA